MSSLMNKLNINPVAKAVKTSGNNSIEKQINALFGEACRDAIKSHPTLKKYFISNLKQSDVFKQVTKKDGTKVIELESLKGEVIAIPVEDVELTNETKKHTLDTAFRVGTIQTYIEGITKRNILSISKSKLNNNIKKALH